MIGTGILIGAVIGYMLGAFTFRDEAQFWKSRADYWYENSGEWMDRWFEDRARAASLPPDTDQ